MKTIISLVIFLTLQVANAQTKNLEFNRVIDTIIKVEATTCVYIGSGYYGDDLIVPSGKVWKMTSFSATTTEPDYNPSPYNSGCSSNNYSSRFYAGLVRYIGVDECLLSKNTNIMISGPLWLKAGSKLRVKMWSTHPSYPSAKDLKCTNALSIIEFNIAQ